MCDDVAGEALDATRLRRVLHCVPVPARRMRRWGCLRPLACHDAHWPARDWPRRTRRGIGLMATIGTVTKREDGRYEGELHTLSLRAAITILPIEKMTPNQPDFRVV